MSFNAQSKGLYTSFNAQNGLYLKEERERLGLTQQEMADASGVRREMLSKYERGVAAPGADIFVALARLGADLIYILTGQRSPSVMPTLNKKEEALLDNYRNSDEKGKRAVEIAASAFAYADSDKKVANGE